ncbi:hypothetical protein V8J88_08510 [Massilia sp. W12]
MTKHSGFITAAPAHAAAPPCPPAAAPDEAAQGRACDAIAHEI